MSSKLYFWYWAMWAGKSMEIAKVYHNYTSRWLQVIVFNSALDNRFNDWKVSSRSWISVSANTFDRNTSFRKEIDIEWVNEISCVLIDEAQFLTSDQVEELAYISCNSGIPIMCYGLKTTFTWELFEWSKRLLELAQSIEEIKTICWCEKKATMNARINDKWDIIKTGKTIDIGWDDKYISLCLKHWLDWNTWKKK